MGTARAGGGSEMRCPFAAGCFGEDNASSPPPPLIYAASPCPAPWLCRQTWGCRDTEAQVVASWAPFQHRPRADGSAGPGEGADCPAPCPPTALAKPRLLTRSPRRCDRSLQRGRAQGVPCRRCLRALCMSPARVGSVPSPCHPWKPFQQAQGMPGSGVYPPATGTVGPPLPHRCLLPAVFAQLQLSSSHRLPRSTKAAEPQPTAGFRAYQAYLPAQLSSSLAPFPFSPCGWTEPGPTRWPKRSQGCQRWRGCSHPCPFWGAPPAPQPSRKC